MSLGIGMSGPFSHIGIIGIPPIKDIRGIAQIYRDAWWCFPILLSVNEIWEFEPEGTALAISRVDP
jgi:hypothetical protein